MKNKRGTNETVIQRQMDIIFYIHGKKKQIAKNSGNNRIGSLCFVVQYR